MQAMLLPELLLEMSVRSIQLHFFFTHEGTLLTPYCSSDIFLYIFWFSGWLCLSNFFKLLGDSFPTDLSHCSALALADDTMSP